MAGSFRRIAAGHALREVHTDGVCFVGYQACLVHGGNRTIWTRITCDGTVSRGFPPGYMSILLPVETGEGEVRRIIRERVVRALAATGEWPIRIHVVTSTGSDDGQTKRWFVEYETGPYGQAIDQPDEPV